MHLSFSRRGNAHERLSLNTSRDEKQGATPTHPRQTHVPVSSDRVPGSDETLVLAHQVPVEIAQQACSALRAGSNVRSEFT